MSGADLLAILPMLVLAGAIGVLLPVVPFARAGGIASAGAMLAFVAALAALVPAAAHAPRPVTPLLVADGYALYYSALVLAAGLQVAILSPRYLAARNLPDGPYALLVLLACLGALVLVQASHFVSFVLGLELLSLALFALVAYPAAEPRPVEAAVKYLVLAGIASAFLLFGMALVYARFGTMAFAALGGRTLGAGLLHEPFLMVGFAVILVGIGFKLSLVPFHMWAPDVFQGAPAPVGGLLASVSKGAMLVLLLRYLMLSGVARSEGAVTVLAVLAVASMLAGNLLALLQDNLKRILAYSSIAHLGYMLVPLVAGGRFAPEAIGYYLAAYFASVLTAFGVLTALSTGRASGDLETLPECRGLFWERPWLATALTLSLLSLAGLPLTMGFVGKFYLVTAGIQGTAWISVAVLIAGSVVGLFYYLRVVIAMAGRRDAAAPAAGLPSPAAGAVLAALTVALVGLGLAPQPLITAIRAAGAPL